MHFIEKLQRDGKGAARPNRQVNSKGFSDQITTYGCPETHCRFMAVTKSAVLGHLRTFHKFKKSHIKRIFIKRITKFNKSKNHRSTKIHYENDAETAGCERKGQAGVLVQHSALASPEVAVGRQGKNELEIWEGDNIVFSLFPLKTQKYIEHKEIDLEKDQDEREKFRKDQAQRLREWAKRSLLKHTQKQSFNSKTISTHSDTTSGATSAAAADCERRLPDIKPVVAVVGDTDESGPERGQCVVMRTPREARWQPEAKDAAASDGDLPWPIGARNQVSETLNGALDNIIAKPVVPSWDGVENDSQENKASFFQTSTRDPYIEYTEALFKGRIPRIKEVIDKFFEITRKRPRDPTWAVVRELVDGTIPTAKMFVWTIAHTLCSS